jgi:hypothetical protein
MLSYVDSLRFGLNFDKAILPHKRDVDELCGCIEEEFRDLLRLTASTSVRLLTLAFALGNKLELLKYNHTCITPPQTPASSLELNSKSKADENGNAISPFYSSQSKASLRRRSVS